MRLSKKILLLLFPLLLIFALAVVTACNDAESPSDAKVALATPQIELTGNVISWNTIEHAASYEIYENSTLIKTVEETSYQIVKTAKGTYTYKIKALSADDKHSSSKFSNEVTYVVTNNKLPAPAISKHDNVISWAAVDHADGYEVYEDGELVSSQSETSYTITRTETGVYKYKVKATSTSSEYLESELSNEITHIISEQLAAPHISLDAAKKKISWQAVPHAETYVIYENGVVLYQSWTRTSYEIEQTIVGEYTYSVVARSSNPAYLMSESSDTVNYTVEPTPLPTPGELSIEDNLLNWTESDNAGYYEIYEDEIIVAKQAHSPYQIPLDHEPGTVEFTVKAFPAKNDKQYLESEVSEPLSHTITDDRTPLETPTGLYHEMREEYKNPDNLDGSRPDEEKVKREYLVWTPVDNAGAYFIYEDGKRIAATQATEYVISEFMPGNHKYQVRAVTTSANFKSSELSDECTYHIDENKDTTFTVRIDTTNALNFNAAVTIELWTQDAKTGLPQNKTVSSIHIPASGVSGSVQCTNYIKYIAKIADLTPGFYASEIELSAAETQGTISIYSATGGLRTLQLDTTQGIRAEGGITGNVGTSEAFLFIAPEKGQYQIVADSGMLCEVKGSERYAFVADQNEAVQINVSGQYAGTFTFKVTKPTKQYINFGDIGYNGPTGQSNTIYDGQTETTFYLHAESENKRYMFLFMTATMSNTRFITLTINGVDYEFDGSYCTTQNILIPSSVTDTEITVTVSGASAGEGIGNVSFYVIPL